MHFCTFTKKCRFLISSFVALCRVLLGRGTVQVFTTQTNKKKTNSSAFKANVHLNNVSFASPFSFSCLFLIFCFFVIREDEFSWPHVLGAVSCGSAFCKDADFWAWNYASVMCSFFLFFFHSRIKSDFVSFLSVNAPSPSAFQMVSSKEKQEISLKALPPPPPSRPPSYHLSSDQSVFVFGRLDQPLHFFFICFFLQRALARACNDSSWTVTFEAWMHIPKRVRPGCQDHTLQQSAA